MPVTGDERADDSLVLVRISHSHAAQRGVDHCCIPVGTRSDTVDISRGPVLLIQSKIVSMPPSANGGGCLAGLGGVEMSASAASRLLRASASGDGVRRNTSHPRR